MLNHIVWIFVVIMVVLLMFSCLLRSLKKVVFKAFLIKREGGVVAVPKPPTDKLTLPWRDVSIQTAI